LHTWGVADATEARPADPVGSMYVPRPGDAAAPRVSMRASEGNDERDRQLTESGIRYIHAGPPIGPKLSDCATALA